MTSETKIIRPAKSAYIAGLNIFPIFMVVYIYIVFTSQDYGSLAILCMVASYIVFIFLFLKYSFIVIKPSKIQIHQFLKPSISIDISHILSVATVHLITKTPNSFMITYDENGQEKNVLIRARRYEQADMAELLNLLQEKANLKKSC